MKEKILLALYDAFAAWSATLPWVCAKGCSTCCTGAVLITALEGERILTFIRDAGREQWLAERLAGAGPTVPSPMTTNEYAAACLEGRLGEDSSVGPDNPGRCPFLEGTFCGIYPVRPFSCRCFASKELCTQERTAVLPDFYIAASTAMLQIIEHLGQNEYWGNMRDVLLALCDISAHTTVAARLPDRTMIIRARLGTRRARPLPGFLFLEAEQKMIAPLLEAVFATRIDGNRIDDILNNTRP